jgi:hypothetical protein
MVGHSASPHSQRRHSFSIEMTSRDHLSRIEVSNGLRDEALIEGDLGETVKVEFIEGIMLQILGDNGVLRIDLEEGELGGILSRVKAPEDGAADE